MRVAARRIARSRGCDADQFVCVDNATAGCNAVLSPRTRLLMVDHITSQTALVLPLAEIAAVCRRRGIAVLDDGAHAPAVSYGLPNRASLSFGLPCCPRVIATGSPPSSTCPVRATPRTVSLPLMPSIFGKDGAARRFSITRTRWYCAALRACRRAGDGIEVPIHAGPSGLSCRIRAQIYNDDSDFDRLADAITRRVRRSQTLRGNA